MATPAAGSRQPRHDPGGIPAIPHQSRRFRPIRGHPRVQRTGMVRRAAASACRGVGRWSSHETGPVAPVSPCSMARWLSAALTQIGEFGSVERSAPGTPLSMGSRTASAAGPRRYSIGSAAPQACSSMSVSSAGASPSLTELVAPFSSGQHSPLPQQTWPRMQATLV
jgi:hypothetical protein